MNKALVIKSHLLIALVAGYFTLALNWAFFLKVYHYLFSLERFDTAFALSLPVFIFSFLYVLFSPMVIPRLTKVLLIPLLLASAAGAYAAIEYGVMLDHGMLENILETHPAEAGSYLSLSSLGFVLIMGGIPALALYHVQIEYQPFWRELRTRAGLMLAAAGLFVGITAGFYESYASVGRNNQHVQKYIIPTELLYGSFWNLRENVLQSTPDYQVLGSDARQQHRAATGNPTFMVMVVGETDRAASHQILGYPRDTDTHSLAAGLQSLGPVQSCGTSTAVSVPCMFSLLQRTGYDRQTARNQDNVLDIIQRAGVRVVWIDNDGGCKGVCARIDSIRIQPAAHPDFCTDDTCRDEVVLTYLDSELQRQRASTAQQPTLVVLHLIGSHGPTYYQRYPDSQRHYTPDCPRSDIQNCTTAALTNTYDNSVRYTGFVLAAIQQRLAAASQDLDTAMLYMADHGESLGENGLYLHGLPYAIAPAEQTRVPAMVWLSPAYTQTTRISASCLQRSTPGAPLSQDHLSHSLLGLMQVDTAAHNRALDISANCGSRQQQLATQSDAAPRAG